MKAAIAFWNLRVRGTERARDVGDAVTVFAVGLLLIWVGLTGAWAAAPSVPTPTSPWWHAVPLAAVCLVMLAKRRRPIAALMAGGSIGVMLGLIDLIYAAALFSGPHTPRRLGVGVGIAVALGSAAVFIASGDPRLTLSTGLTIFAILGTPLWWGISVRQQRELAELASARADDLKRLSDLREAEVVQQERTRMARDLHDALASNLSAIAIHSEAAILADPGGVATGPEREALAAIRSASVSSLEEMRSMIMLLRTGDDSITSPARLKELSELVGAARQRGLDVTVTQFPDELPVLPSAVDQAAYRILQEALTNAARHSPSAGTRVAVAIDRREVQLRVENDLTDAPAVPTHQTASGGLGLTTMRERAELLGGTFHAGHYDAPGNQDSWVVSATLPLTGQTP